MAGAGAVAGAGAEADSGCGEELDAPSQIFELPLTALEGLRFPAEAAQFIFDGKARAAAEEEWARVAAQGATVVTFGCAEYPERLKEIYDPPPVLWVRGTVQPAGAAGDCGGGDAASDARMGRAWRRCFRGTWRRGGC